MTPIPITIGQHKTRPQGQRVILNSGDPVGELYALLGERPPGDETWWSGHIWAGDTRAKDSRTKIVNWEGSGCVTIDVDYYSNADKVSARHAAPPKDVRGALVETGLQCSIWHETPRGVRVVFVLDQIITDPGQMGRVTSGAANYVNDQLEEAGVLGALDHRKKPIGGYYADEATFDLARFMYAPNATIDGQSDKLMFL